MSVVVAHTGQLASAVLGSAHELLQQAFPPGEFGQDDWQHCLGGLHALVWQGPELVAHAALVPRRLLHGGRSWRTGYVEGLAVRADVRRRGHGTAVLTALERLASRSCEIAALSATQDGAALYAARGWQIWRGPTSVLTPAGTVRTPDDDGSVHVLPLAAGRALDLDGELSCDAREGDPW